MVSHGLKGVVGAIIAGSLVFSSTAAAASTTTSAQPVNPWAVLSAMSAGAPSAVMCGTAAAAAAAAQTPTGCVLPALDAAPPPVETAGAGISPWVLGLLALAGIVGVALALGHSGNGNSPA